MGAMETVDYQQAEELAHYLSEIIIRGEEVCLSPSDLRLAALGLSLLAHMAGFVQRNALREDRIEAL